MQPKEAKTIKNAMPYLMRNLNVDHSFLSNLEERAILRPCAIEVISVSFFEYIYIISKTITPLFCGAAVYIQPKIANSAFIVGAGFVISIAEIVIIWIVHIFAEGTNAYKESTSLVCLSTMGG